MNISLPQHTQEIVHFFAKEANISDEALMQAAIESYIEDLQEVKEAELAYIAYLKSGKKSISATKAHKKPGLT